MKNIYFKSSKNQDFETLPRSRHGAWIEIYDASHEEVKSTADFLGLSFEDLRDSLDIYEVPRIERKKDKVIIFVRYPSRDIPGLFTNTLCIVVTPSLIITISKNHNKLLTKIRKQERDLTSTQSSRLLIKILSEVTKDFTDKISLLIREVTSGKRELNLVDSHEIEDLIKHEEILNQYLSALLPMKNVLETMNTSNYIKVYNGDGELLNDLSISVNQSANLCNVNLQSIQNLRDAHQIYFTNKLNKSIQTLTIFTILMSVPMIIASIFGMNIGLPMADHPAAFIMIVVLSVILSYATFLFMKYRGWT